MDVSIELHAPATFRFMKMHGVTVAVWDPDLVSYLKIREKYFALATGIQTSIPRPFRSSCRYTDPRRFHPIILDKNIISRS
jgi:hypothetical protein